MYTEISMSEINEPTNKKTNEQMNKQTLRELDNQRSTDPVALRKQRRGSTDQVGLHQPTMTEHAEGVSLHQKLKLSASMNSEYRLRYRITYVHGKQVVIACLRLEQISLPMPSSVKHFCEQALLNHKCSL